MNGVRLHELRWIVDVGFVEECNSRHLDELAIDQHWRELDREFAGVVGHSDIDDEY
jgi:hypothetical protein